MTLNFFSSFIYAFKAFIGYYHWFVAILVVVWPESSLFLLLYSLSLQFCPCYFFIPSDRCLHNFGFVPQGLRVV